MSGLSPNFDDWAKVPSLEIWEAAALMLGYDPRAFPDVIVMDPDSPSSVYGVPLDTNWEERQIINSVELGRIILVKPDQNTINKKSKITMVSYRNWLRSTGRSDLAESLDGPGSDQSAAGCEDAIPVPAIQKMRSAILEILLKQGYDNKQLPPRTTNEPGIKAEVRELLFPNAVERRSKKKTFDKAWQSLRDFKLIVELK
jgi:hypothetical protein